MQEEKVRTEKRRYPRVRPQIPVRYRKQEDPAGSSRSGSLTADVSAGGLMFRTNELLTAACKLILELDLPTSARPIQATSKVSWVGRDNAEEGYKVGNQFMEINMKDQDLIMQYLKSIQ